MCGLSILAFFNVLSIYLKTHFVFKKKKLHKRTSVCDDTTYLQASKTLTTRGSYNQKSYNQGFLQPGSYDQGFLTPGVSQEGVLTTRGLTTRGSYNKGHLKPGLLQPGVLTTRGS